MLKTILKDHPSHKGAYKTFGDTKLRLKLNHNKILKNFKMAIDKY